VDFGFDLGARSTAPIATDWHDGQITTVLFGELVVPESAI
jgi:hypothetical protein